ncbi:MAG: UDP-2,3-diacylglucosamine diphosphatase [Saprospiraceae bacterium]|nr:UDP-2,3-diacylglucosamine diphosphatase [Saprospiraceae bacterium]
MVKRALDIAIISDVHLGTFACHAKELLQYLHSIHPKKLVLNGDFIDIWEFRKRSFPKEHVEILHQVMKMASQGTKVYYLTGNHDDIMRKFSPFQAGNIILRDKLVLQIDQKRYWIFHGDVFDATVTISPLIAKLGGRGYNWLIRLNRLINKLRKRLGYLPLSLANKVKHSVKRASKYISDFESAAIAHAKEQNYDYVICGHIHLPQMRHIPESGLTYMNAGDWVENLTALEYRNKNWALYHYDPADYKQRNSRLHPTNLYKLNNTATKLKKDLADLL